MIETYITENGTEPITGESLTEEDLIDLKTAQTVRPRPPTHTSIPSLLKVFQDEWDALALETYTLRQNLAQTRQDLSNALYQHDAAVRVIARLTKERDEARKALSEVQVTGPATNGDAMHVDPTPLPDSIKSKIEITQETLSKTRRKRPVPEDWATGETVSSYSPKLTSKAFFKGGNSLAVDESGDLALVGSDEGAAGVYSVSQNQILHTLSTGGGSVTGTLWAGDRPIVSSSTGKVIVFKPRSDSEEISFDTHSGSATAIALHPSGDILASVGSDGTYALYDLENLRPLTQVPGGASKSSISWSRTSLTSAEYTCAQFHPDGHILAAGGTDGNIKIFDVKSGTEAATFEVGSPLQKIVFSENGIWFAAVVQGSTAVSIWDIRKSAEITSIETSGLVESIDWDYSGQFLASAGPSGITVSQYIKSTKEWTEPLKTATPAKSVAWGLSAQNLLTASEDGVINVLG